MGLPLAALHTCPSAWGILLALLEMANRSGRTKLYVNRNQLARSIGSNRVKTITRALALLVEEGLITVKRRAKKRKDGNYAGQQLIVSLRKGALNALQQNVTSQGKRAVNAPSVQATSWGKGALNAPIVSKDTTGSGPSPTGSGPKPEKKNLPPLMDVVKKRPPAAAPLVGASSEQGPELISESQKQ